MGLASRVDSQQRDAPVPGTLGELVLAGPEPAAAESEWASLVRSIAARDERSLHALYQRTHRFVFTLIVRITRDPEAGEELTVDVFDDVWRRAAEYDVSSGSVVAWVMNLARSRALARLRLEGRNERADASGDEQAVKR